MSAILKFDFQKRKQNFSEEKSKLLKKDIILHTTITFSLKQRETRTGSGPICDPLTAKHCNTQGQRKTATRSSLVSQVGDFVVYLHCNVWLRSVLTLAHCIRKPSY